jgi:carboxypeptidase Taq
MNAKFEELRTRLGEISDLSAAASLLNWDQHTYMPSGGAKARATVVATLSRATHQRFVSDEIGQLLDDLEPAVKDLGFESFEASLVRVTRRNYDRQRKLPADLVAELAQARALGDIAWRQARQESDFSLFESNLEEIFDLTIQMAEALGYEERPYDALLDRYEPEMKTSELERLFGEMKAALVPLVSAIAERGDVVDDSFLFQNYAKEKQWGFGVEVIERLGFDFEHGRQDFSAHPFTTSLSQSDVRLTTRILPDQFKPGFFATVHESGHGMHGQGIDRVFDRTPLRRSASAGVGESQSRLWENVVGRSRGFWSYWLPRLQEVFPAQLAGVDPDTFYRAVNRVKPSLIRIEADEVTYNLHILLRFEIENLMLDRKVRIADVPELWNAKVEEYLGLRPQNDAEGVLQDMHWGSGLIGYFPGYSLGNLLAAQFYEQALSEQPGIPAQIEAGEYRLLFDWMREKVQMPGAKYTPAELVERVTGGPIQTEPFLRYVREKYTDIYEL